MCVLHSGGQLVIVALTHFEARKLSYITLFSDTWRSFVNQNIITEVPDYLYLAYIALSTVAKMNILLSLKKRFKVVVNELR